MVAPGLSTQSVPRDLLRVVRFLQRDWRLLETKAETAGLLLMGPGGRSIAPAPFCGLQANTKTSQIPGEGNRALTSQWDQSQGFMVILYPPHLDSGIFAT